jgi:immune inhibitor A
MRKPFLALLTGALAVVLSVGVGASTAGGASTAAKEPTTRPSDNLTSPLAEKQSALRAVGLQRLASGQLPAGTKVAKIAKGQYVQLAREGEDSIWTVLGEFGAQINPDPRLDGDGAVGPLHNQIPQPDRTVDNTTIWASDFNRPHYEDLLFDDAAGQNSMRNFYKEQSSNRYTVNGEVTDWVQVPFNEANYGANYCGDIVCARTWLFVRDSVNAWYNAQVAAGKSQADINAALAKFDVWDRYDHDGDGNFNEPDGYIDHFQSIHAGMGEEVGGGAQGTDAIWSHRWYVQLTPIGGGGPTLDDGTVVAFGGVRVGNTKYWIGDYTVEPENGGVGVFSHEFAHDLLLPDEYDTSGNTGGAENSTAWWTLMSQGSYGTQTDDLGTSPTHMNAWDKFQLGWLNYEVAFAGQKSEHKLGPAEYNTKQAQGVFVVLPQKSVPLNLGDPYEGPEFFYSGAGNDLDNTMTRSVTVGAGGSLTAQVRYDIETDWDYAYLTVNGNPVHTDRSTNTNPHGQNFGEGITGSSGGNWVSLTAGLSAFAGQTVTLGFRYWTDGATVGSGFQVDAIKLNGTALDDGWTFNGFRATSGHEIQMFNQYYLAENRQYTGYDDSLRLGPYNFGFPSLPNFVEHLPYQDGVLIWYWDTSLTDNNVGDHPGDGLILPIDSHPQILHWSDGGAVMRPRLQAFDATFSTQPTDAITVHNPATGVATSIPSRPGVSVFDDLQDWWVAGDPGDAPGNTRYQAEWNSVNVPKTGTQIRIQSETKGGFTQIEVRPSK